MFLLIYHIFQRLDGGLYALQQLSTIIMFVCLNAPKSGLRDEIFAKICSRLETRELSFETITEILDDRYDSLQNEGYLEDEEDEKRVNETITNNEKIVLKNWLEAYKSMEKDSKQ